jgi:general stress protein 26
VNLSYADPGNSRFVSVSGVAAVVKDPAKAKELWSPLYTAWFPKGLDDPELSLLMVRVRDAEYWDAPSGKMIQLAKIVKAAAMGTAFQPEPGAHAKLSLS